MISSVVRNSYTLCSMTGHFLIFHGSIAWHMAASCVIESLRVCFIPDSSAHGYFFVASKGFFWLNFGNITRISYQVPSEECSFAYGLSAAERGFKKTKNN